MKMKQLILSIASASIGSTALACTSQQSCIANFMIENDTNQALYITVAKTLQGEWATPLPAMIQKGQILPLVLNPINYKDKWVANADIAFSIRSNPNTGCTISVNYLQSDANNTDTIAVDTCHNLQVISQHNKFILQD